MKKALIIIDVQKYYINKHTQHIPSQIVEYIKQASFDFILFAKFVNHENSNVSRVFDWKKMQKPPDTDICDELLGYINDENVFEKDTYSIFKSKLFINYLKENNIKDLTVCGFDTDACVLASSYDAFDLGYEVSVIEDLTVSHCGNEYRDSGLTIVKKNIGLK